MSDAAPAPAGTTFPGKTLGIVGLVLSIATVVVGTLGSIAGIVVSAIALKQSKAAGYTNTPAKVGLILGIVLTVLSIIAIIVIVAVIAGASAYEYGTY